MAPSDNNRPATMNLLPYLVKAAALLGILFALSRLLPAMPAWAVGLTWALASLIPALGVAYHTVIRKTYRQQMYRKGGHASWLNAGRMLSLIVTFAGSAVLVASLLIESPTWATSMWVVLALAVPGYYAVSLPVGRVVRREYAPLYHESRTAMWSAAVLGVLLCIAYAAMMFAQPETNYAHAADAFLAAPRPFEHSPSALMREAGEAAALVDGLRSYALSKAAEGSFGGYVAWQLVLGAGSLFAFASMLATCAIDLRELERVFRALETQEERGQQRPVLKRAVALSAILPIALTAAFVAADANAARITESRGYTLAQQFAQRQLSLTVYAFDGKYYDPQGVDELLDRAHKESLALTEEAQQKLTSLVNESFDARIANVDGYLDWYYRLFGDYEQLYQMVKGTAEDFAKEQFSQHIEQGIDDSALAAELDKYRASSEELRQRTIDELSQYEVTGDYPAWLVAPVEGTQALEHKIDMSLEPSQEFLDASTRLGLSAAGGLVAGVIAKKLLSRVAQKAFFKTAASRIGGLAALSGASAAGGVLLTVVTLAGGLVFDVVAVKADEALHREEYKQEIIEMIEEQRAEMLAAIGAQEGGGS